MSADTITLSSIDSKLQERLQNNVGSPLSQNNRVSIINDTLQFMQNNGNYRSTRKVVIFDYLNGESDYSIENTLGVTDFKKEKEVRIIDSDLDGRHTEQFELLDDKDMSVRIGERSFHKSFNIVYRDNEAFLPHHSPHPDRFRGPGMDQFYGEEGGDDLLLRWHRGSGFGSGGPGSASQNRRAQWEIELFQ